MSVSIFSLFKIGIGPSSSHTVGPMLAASRFLMRLETHNVLEKVERIEVNLYGSLALTGLGHATDKAIIVGLSGHKPDTIDPAIVDDVYLRARDDGQLSITASHIIRFNYDNDMVFNCDLFLPQHANGMKFIAYDDDGEINQQTYYSIGGGFILSGEELENTNDSLVGTNVQIPHPFNSANELMKICEQCDQTIAQVVMANECANLSEREVNDGIDTIAKAMDDCINRGIAQTGVLPGGLNVKRRANDIHNFLMSDKHPNPDIHLQTMDWVNLFALAVNEENANGGRVVTAPTNGAAGVIPAVLRYYKSYVPNANQDGVRNFLLTAAAIATLYHKNASISAAEVGCQGEVGVACSMAAAALCAVLGGSIRQVENAAEIGMEHNLGLTCDPIGGLVQIPCIERNTMGALKAINAARLALLGNGNHHVSLDSVIQTMWETGKDMQSKYKETSTGGLATNMVAC